LAGINFIIAFLVMRLVAMASAGHPQRRCPAPWFHPKNQLTTRPNTASSAQTRASDNAHSPVLCADDAIGIKLHDAGKRKQALGIGGEDQMSVV